MSKSKIFIFLALSFGVGVLAASKFDMLRPAVYVVLAIGAVAFALAFVGHHKAVMLAAAMVFAAALGTFRLQLSMAPSQYQPFLDSKQQWEGYITEDPAVKGNGQTLVFRPDGFRQEIQISTTLTQSFFYGDRVVVDGKLTEAKNFGDFDYQSYLRRYNIYAVIGYPTKILILKSNGLNPAKFGLLKIKQGFVNRLSELLREPQTSLALGILLGGHGSLPQNIVNDFNATGTSHIIAVSGFNITIIVTALASLAYLLGRKQSFWLATLTIIGFVIITGATASVVRAAIMGFLLLLALNIGRQYSIVPSLFFAGLIMLIINPKILYWDVGFQLSFAATLGIVYFMPVLEKLSVKLPPLLGAKTLILTTLSAIAATLPIILYNFGTLSLSAPVVNVLVLPVVPFAMLFGFLAVLPFLGAGFALAANGLLIYIIRTIGFFGTLPYSSLNFQIPAWVFYVLCALVFGIYFCLKLLASKYHPVDPAPVFSGTNK